MSKIGNYYLMREEKALDEMQQIQRDISTAQDTFQPVIETPDYVEWLESETNKDGAYYE